MKILQLIQKCQLRGAEIFACQLAEELHKNNNQVDIVYLFDYADSLPFKLKFIPLHGNSKRRFWDIRAYKRLSDIIKDGKYDIVQANAGDTLKYAAISKFLYGWRTTLIFRNANKMGDFVRNFIHLKLNRWFLARCDYFISVSENCRQDLIQIFPPALNRSVTITIGTEIRDHILPIEIKKDRPIIINIGGLVPEKNHLFLLGVFKAYTEKHKGTLIIVGDGRLRETLEDKVRSLKLMESVLFMGPRKDVHQILKAADVMVMPSKIEGMPAVILEAFSMGVPVIASNVGGITEIIEDGITGFCIATMDTQSYLEKIELVLSDKTLRENVTRNGKELVLSNFQLSFIASKFFITYQSLSKKD